MDDLTGQRFNNWLVLEYCGKSEWLCECQCDKRTKRKVRTYMLKSGGSKSCGCGRVTYQETDLTGRTCGFWKVLRKDKDRARHFICLCTKCGEVERSVFSGDLKSGKSISCGCIKRANIIGNRYGELDVLSYDKEKCKYKCACSCGNEVYCTAHDLENGRAKTCGKHDKFIDISGKVFGDWTAIEYTGNYRWLCKCSCGVKREIGRYELISGKSTNCGHNRKEDLSGKSFGMLRVLRYLGDCKWECKCECGNNTIVTSGNLKSGNTKSCGCNNISLQNSKTYEEIMQCINKYSSELGELPYPEDIANRLNVTVSAVYKYIRKYNLHDFFNKEFGSRYEKELYNFLKKYVDNVVVHDRKILNGLELDLYIPSHSLAIEFNGTYWHSADKKDKYYHQNKTIECAKKGIQLIHIFEYEWNNKEVRDKILKIIENKLSSHKCRIYARETEVKLVNSYDTKEFLDRYHLQSYSNSIINIGLYHKGELVSLLTFGSPRFNNNYEYEIIRYCNKSDTVIIGGIQKMFKFFVDRYKPDSILTYSDISKFTGNVYTKLGFNPVRQNPITEPSYVWVNEVSEEVMQRYQTQKHKLIKAGLGDIGETEVEIMTNNGFIQVFNCGNIKLEWFSGNK